RVSTRQYESELRAPAHSRPSRGGEDLDRIQSRTITALRLTAGWVSFGHRRILRVTQGGRDTPRRRLRVKRNSLLPDEQQKEKGTERPHDGGAVAQPCNGAA